MFQKQVLKFVSFFSLFAIAFTACSKGEPNNGSTSNPPTNLMVTTIVNADNSGNVAFTATATNATTYDFDFGNGAYQTVVSGSVTYKYSSSGTYSVNVIAKSANGQVISKSISITVSVLLSIIWSDEFDGSGAPDANKWGYDIGTGGNGWGNNELEYYTNRSNNVSVSNGTLKITAIKEAYSSSAYTSARILTQNKFSTKYGRIEVRAKLPVGVGTWPAIWMLGNNISTVSWPTCGEIDIMEHLGRDLNKIYGTFHYPGRSGANADGSSLTITNATTEFHIYSTEWSATSIKLLVDGKLIHTLNNTSSLPFNQNFFIILNVAMGGTFAGPVDSSFVNSTMEIDYVRVYQ